jgi:hypothetical protein
LFHFFTVIFTLTSILSQLFILMIFTILFTENEAIKKVYQRFKQEVEQNTLEWFFFNFTK